jgi:2-aminoethylphosphonate-pyruvate transaminase
MLLLIPGPVTTHSSVRAAAAQDYAPWDLDFRDLLTAVRERVLAIAGGRPGEHAVLPLQGCGHFAMEAAFRTFLPPGGTVLVPLTGQYADRLVRLATEAGRRVTTLAVPPTERVDPVAVEAALAADPAISHLAIVYSETATGIVHDAPFLAEAAGRAGRRVLIDAVSAFGAMPMDIGRLPMVDSVTFTSNKCFEGLPGMALTVARVDSLRAGAGRAASWSLDLADIHAHGERFGLGSHRFTPVPQAIAAFSVALDRFDAEGGQPARLARYTANMGVIYDGVRSLGLQPCLPREVQGPIVVNVEAPADPAWNLQAFVDHLKRRGILISNFYNTAEPSFRVGCIGAITPDDMRAAIQTIGEAMTELGLQSRRAA